LEIVSWRGVVTLGDQSLMDSLVELQGARWRQAGETGMIAANRSEAFLREVVDLFGSRGWLRFFTLRFEGRIAAIILAFCNQTTLFGSVLLANALQYPHDRGYRAWDFLRGEEPCKFFRGAQALSRRRVMIVR
jgi:hypothetical protein